MATSSQIKSLVSSHAAGDDERFYSVALQVAARAARAGQSKYALELQDLIDRAQRTNRRNTSITDVSLSAHPGWELFEYKEPRINLADLFLSRSLRQSMDEVLFEHSQRDRLAEFNLEPSRKFLFVGPPGTGKTSTAEALAAELDRPLLTLKLEKLITRYMGETASKLAAAFELIKEFDALYLFDEVDAVAGERAASNDVGEMRRILNSFLQLLDDDHSQSVIIAATNHPQLLDRAFFRRFDELFVFDRPSKHQATRILAAYLSAFDTSAVDWEGIGKLLPGLSQADLQAAAQAAAKESILHYEGVICNGSLRNALRRKKAYLNE